MFNLLSVGILLPIEVAFGYLETVTDAIVKPISHNNPNAKEPEMLNAITKPLTEAIIQIDKHILDSIATNKSFENASLIKRLCKNRDFSHKLVELSLNETLNANDTSYAIENSEYVPCKFLFNSVMWPEWLIGLLLLIASLITLSACLVTMVKILSSIFNGPVAKVIQKVVNSDLPGVFKYFTAILAISVLNFVLKLRAVSKFLKNYFLLKFS